MHFPFENHDKTDNPDLVRGLEYHRQIILALKQNKALRQDKFWQTTAEMLGVFTKEIDNFIAQHGLEFDCISPHIVRASFENKNNWINDLSSRDKMLMLAYAYDAWRGNARTLMGHYFISDGNEHYTTLMKVMNVVISIYRYDAAMCTPLLGYTTDTKMHMPADVVNVSVEHAMRLPAPNPAHKFDQTPLSQGLYYHLLCVQVLNQHMSASEHLVEQWRILRKVQDRLEKHIDEYQLELGYMGKQIIKKETPEMSLVEKLGLLKYAVNSAKDNLMYLQSLQSISKQKEPYKVCITNMAGLMDGYIVSAKNLLNEDLEEPKTPVNLVSSLVEANQFVWR